MRDRLPNRLLLRVLGALAIVAAGAGVGILAGGGGEGPAVSTTTAGSQPTGTGRVFLDDLLPRATGRQDRAFVRRTLATLPDRQKVAQVFAWGVGGAPPPERVRELRGLGIGGVVVSDAGDKRGLVRALGARAGLSPLVVTSATDGDPRVLRGAGVRAALAPQLDVGADDSLADVVSLAETDVSGYRDAGVLAAPGPFPGLGGASQLPTDGPANVTLSARQLQRRDIRPFGAAVRTGAPAIQLSNGLYAYDDFVTPASLSRAVIGGQLRRRLGFTGMVVTGNLSEAGVTALEPPERSAPAALRAGADLLYVGGAIDDQRAAYRAVLRALRRGDARTARQPRGKRRPNAFRARLDEAVERVLTAKRDYGLLR